MRLALVNECEHRRSTRNLFFFLDLQVKVIRYKAYEVKYFIDINENRDKCSSGSVLQI